MGLLKLRTIDRGLKKAVLFSMRKPIAVLTIAMTLFAFFATCAGLWSRQTVALEDQLDSDFKSTQELRDLKRLFPDDANVGLILPPPKDDWTQIRLCELRKDLADLARTNSHITDTFTAFDLRKAELSPGKLHYMPLVKDPCGSETLPATWRKGLSGSPWEGILTNEKTHDLIAFLSVAPVDPPGNLGRFNLSGYENLMAKADQNFGKGLLWTGLGAQEYFTFKGMSQTQVLNLAMAALIWIMLRFFFGSWKAGAIFISSLTFTAAIVYGGMSFCGHPLDPLAICLMMMLAVASLEDFVFLSYDQMERKNGFITLVTPSFFTSFTTMIGFGSLIVSNLYSISRFGFWAGLGSMVEWACLFLVLPALIRVFPSLGRWVEPNRAFARKSLLFLSQKTPPRWIARLSLLVFVAAGFGITHLQLAQDPSSMFPKDHVFQRSLDYLRKTRGWVAQANLILKPGFEHSKKTSLIETIKREPHVVRIESYDTIFDFVASDVKEPRWRELVRRELSISHFFERFVARSGEERVILYLDSTNTQIVNRLHEEVQKICPQHECRLVGEFVAFSEFSIAFIKTLFESLLLSVGLVAAVLAFLSAEFEKKWFIPLALSSFWGPAWMLFYLYLSGSDVNSITCVVASTVVGLTGDNAIQYLFASRQKNLSSGIGRMGSASISCSIIMSLACLVFLGSYFAPARDLGILFVIGFLSSLAGDLWILKGLIKKD
jgi:predicted RND superfamily exporter protein